MYNNMSSVLWNLLRAAVAVLNYWPQLRLQ
jgi:hypothetical protein